MKALSRNWNSVHAKLLRTILISFTVGTVVAGTFLFVVGYSMARTSMIDGLSVTGKILADRSAAALLFMDRVSARDNLSSAKNRQNIDFLCLYDASGNLFSSYASSQNMAVSNSQSAGIEIQPRHHNSVKSGNGSPTNHCHTTVTPESVSRVTEGRDFIGIYVPIIDQSELLGHIYLQANTQSLSKTQWVFTFILLGALFFSLVVAYLLGGRLVHRSLLPLAALYKTSTIIAKNPFSSERAKKISDDEIGRVVDVFNSMLDNLSSESEALKFSESRFRTLSENAPIGVFMKNDYGSYEYNNSRWSEITGLDISCTSSFETYIKKGDRAAYRQAIELACSSNTAQVIEFQYLNPERGERVLMEYISPVVDGSGKQLLIGSLLDVTELKVAQSELEKLAFYDPLTHLPNRRFFRDHLDLAISRADKEGKKIALYMTDLDDFKKVNDSLGHDRGDQLLIDIAHRLQNSLRDGEIVSRMGGDEFLILQHDLGDAIQLDHASNRFLAALETSVTAAGQAIQITGSIGIAIYPNDADSPEELLRYADMALYNAKESGGNRASYYSRELDHKIKEKIRMEHKLRQALKERKLDVYIQPQFVADSHQMYWGEALLRWFDEEEGYIPPDTFISQAEETGLIYEIGEFVFDRILQLLADNLASLNLLGIQGISVNLSAKQFFSPHFVEIVANKFKSFNVNPALVEFEITETTVMDDVGGAVQVMDALRSLGCRLSIDDFGTGYSSLAYLKKFPITCLKIDKSFIRDIPEDQNDVQIAIAIIAMAHSLGLSVVAEGVETEIQARILAKYKCDYLQGYFFDRPMSIADLLNRVPQLKNQQMV